MKFPIPLDAYQPLSFSLSQKTLLPRQLQQLQANIQLVRDMVVFASALGGAKGLGGHTGGAYDITPEVLICDAFMRGNPDQIVPVFYDEAGHRVIIQYIMAALNNWGLTAEDLLHYRVHGHHLYGHPERLEKKGILFSSGRLGHLWSYVNGVAEQNPDKKVVLFGSDGSQMEGNDSEAARYAVAHKLHVVLLIDDNDVTIEGHPSAYMHGFNVAQTLSGHGLSVNAGKGEDIASLYARIQTAFTKAGPVVLINKRAMAPGISGIEGSTKGHDCIEVEHAIHYLEQKGYAEAVELLKTAPKTKDTTVYLGSSKEQKKNRSEFGKIVINILNRLPEEQRKKVLVMSNDLGGSCGLDSIGKAYPEFYRMAGVMERNNFSVAAGFGSKPGYQGIYGTFSAFLEMVISEITMARLNNANVLAHFSHAGVDEMADNTCHFGINNFFADNGICEDDNTRLYFPADAQQLQAVLEKIFYEAGLRFVFSTRSGVPSILNGDGSPHFGAGYRFTGNDEVIREGTLGYIVTFGEMVYRCLHAVEELKKEGISVGLVNKPVLNVVDEQMMKKLGATPFVLVVESQNYNTGLGSKFGTWLLERGFAPRYAHLGTTKIGQGGILEQIPNQGLAPSDIKKRVRDMLTF
ncbi:transketolase [Candidatus Woesearchaeota archaeon]|nr:transketolase [Candidatus Woesearchaeota archaeon]